MTTIHPKLSTLLDHSAYAVRWLTARPEWSSEIGEMAASPVSEAVIEGLLKAAMPTEPDHAQSIDDLAANLRLARQKFMLLIAARDFNGTADVQEVTQAMSCFAEKVTAVAIEAIRQDIKPTVGEPLNQQGDYSPRLIVGMGKLGGRELNVSSDIDFVNIKSFFNKQLLKLYLCFFFSPQLIKAHLNGLQSSSSAGRIILNFKF
jgi:glutamate-ammonia-ligase adenylyltransferase